MSKAFGEQNPNQGEDAVSWQTWSDGAGGSPTITGDADWGKLHLDLSGAEGRSAVYDLGSAVARKFTLTENRYGTGTGDASLEIRGDTVSFNQDDDLPNWVSYISPFTETWRYVQIRETAPDNVLRVSSANARYLTNNDGKALFLAGSHTWENLQIHNGGTFDWDVYINDLHAWGHNFSRLWVWESPTPNGAPNLMATGPMSLGIWQRTGPGNAADGGLKYDLTQYNSDHFNAIRSRCIQAGNLGVYVMISLFNGFSVADKGCAGDPWPYHPMNAANNINSIDGDTNADGDGYETQDHSVAGILTLQDAYIEHLIDTVNDLDNVLFEVCNEPIASAGTTAWVAHVIDKIHTYEAGKSKQHPVIYTVEYPGGDNSVLLASDAEGISPNSDVTCDGTKVVIPDTDHYFGIGGSADWAWKEFTSGAGGVLYMDSWDNLYLDGSGSGHPVQNLRDNLGYILALAELTDLIHTVPQGGGASPCATGYCLQPSSASYHQYICYQPDNGAFNLNLSAESGSFNIRKVNLADGSINTSQSTTGGATRSITQPTGWTTGWAAWVYP